jgi:hypothetical protein
VFILCLCFPVRRLRPRVRLNRRPRSPTDCVWDQDNEKQPSLKNGTCYIRRKVSEKRTNLVSIESNIDSLLASSWEIFSVAVS